ncbi:MAG TPA: sulfite exporter TauE/SafE family protein [Thermoanaerobaculia bacterium]|nr:sulfite exporter TauE/SafE family protein [Thermoanaerobaculia bacterium]
MTLLEQLIIFVAAGLAGAINSIAGGGTLISFPTLLWLGRDPILANATSTVALWPGSFAGAVGFRRDLATAKRWLYYLAIPSLLGGIVGAILLLRTSPATFARLVPLLIFGATLLFAGQEIVSRRMQGLASAHESGSRRWIAAAFAFQFLVGIYGGYFGAGIGILMLAALGLIGMTDLHQMNGLKNVLALCINGVAAIWFIIAAAVIWVDALVMAAGAILGGYLGAHVAHRFGRRFVRYAVVTIGLIMTIALLRFGV